MEIKTINSTCDYGYATTKAKIKNNTSSNTYTYIKVKVSYYRDKACNDMITFSETYAVGFETLGPGESKIFTDMTSIGNNNYYWYNIEIIDYQEL